MKYTADQFLAHTAPYIIHKVDCGGSDPHFHILGGYIADILDDDEALDGGEFFQNAITGEYSLVVNDLTVSMN